MQQGIHQSKMAQWSINVLLSIISIVVFFVIIEGTLRITGLQTVAPNPPKIYQKSSNPNISYELIPNLINEKAYKAHVSTDEHGFRLNGTQPPTPNPQPPTYAILGDSIAFGHGVEDNETLAAKLEQASQRDNTPIQFLNAAVPGYQLEQETAVYTEKVAPLQPDGVILVFFWNDLNAGRPGILDAQGILRGHDWTPSNIECAPIETGILKMLPAKCWLDTHSAFYKAFKKLMNRKAMKQAQQEERNEERAAEHDPVERKHLVEYAKEVQILAKHLPTQRIFIIWPDNFLHTKSREQLTTIAERNGFTVIDLYEHFGNAVETLPWDTVHPSPQAIQKAAEYIIQSL